MKRSSLVIGLSVAGIAALLVVAFSLVSASNDSDSTPDLPEDSPLIVASPQPSATPQPPATTTPVPAQPTTPPAVVSPDSPVSSGPLPGVPPTRPTLSPQPSVPNAGPPPANTTVVEAPIESIDILVRESFPPQYGLMVSAGLPSGCAKPYTYEVVRDANTIRVRVLNTMAIADACTMIYGMYDVNINLGSDFQSGVTYTVIVNGESKTFVAQ